MRLFRSTLATAAALCAFTTGIVVAQPALSAHAADFSLASVRITLA
ncbi:hypothetical protein [Streptomyces sp. UG1]